MGVCVCWGWGGDGEEIKVCTQTETVNKKRDRRCWKQLVVTGMLQPATLPPTHDEPRLHPTPLEVRQLIRVIFV